MIDLNRKRTICTFVNIRVVILDNYRYFSPKTNDFLILFRHTNCSVYSSVNKWKSYVKFIQSTFCGTNIRYHCRFELYDVFSCKSNSTNKLLFFNYENQTLVKHCSLDIISSFFQIINYPDLLLFSVKIVHGAIKIHVNKLFPHFQNLFVFHLKKSFYDRIYHTEIILIHSFAFLLIMSETKTVIKYLFDLSNKTIVELYKKKLEVESIKTQLFHYKNILHSKRFVQNDCEEKTVAKCCICYSYNVNCMFLPCGHLCCCHHCGKSDKLSKCPLCRDSIESKQVTYISTNKSFFFYNKTMSISVLVINTVNLILLCGSFALLRKKLFCDENTRMINLCLYVILFIIIMTIYTLNSFSKNTPPPTTNDENDPTQNLNESSSGSIFTIIIFLLIVCFIFYSFNCYNTEFSY